MNTQTHDGGKSKQSDGSILEQIAEEIDPPSRKVSDEELIDPGANTPPDSPAETGKEDKPRQVKPQ